MQSVMPANNVVRVVRVVGGRSVSRVIQLVKLVRVIQ